MLTNVCILFITLLTFLGLAGTSNAETRGEIVGTRVIWDGAPINRDTDIVRFNNNWYVVCCETTSEFSNDAALRIITSVDGERWESAALLQGPSPKASYRYDPAFSVRPDGSLMVSALGLRTFAWCSEDGRTWSARKRIGQDHFEYSRDAWNKGVALKYAHGTHDGNSSTMQILSSQDGEHFQNLLEVTSESIPDDGTIMFVDDRAYCVFSRQAANPIAESKSLGRQFQNGSLGMADAPYSSWTWQPIDAPISVPNLLLLPDKRVIAAVGLSHKRDCITLCELNLATGELKQFLDLPIVIENLIQAAYHRQNVGLAYNDGHLWVSYHATHNDKLCVLLTKVKLAQPSAN